MLVVSVTFRIEPGRMEAFLPIMQANARASRETEPGCQRFDICLSQDAPDTVYLYEVYDDAEAFEAHKRTDHYARFGAEGGPMIADKAVQLWTLANG